MWVSILKELLHLICLQSVTAINSKSSVDVERGLAEIFSK